MNWRPKEDWLKNKNQAMIDLKDESYPARRAYEAGADTMHQADMDYLKAREYSLDYSHKGYVHVTYDFTREDWQEFKVEKEEKNENKD